MKARWAVLALAASMTACGDEPKETGVTGSSVLAKDGVLGRWAFDCAMPFGKDNPYLTYAISASGEATEHVQMGPKRDRVTQLENIAELEGGLVRWSQKAGEGVATIVTKIEGRRMKTWHASHSDGTLMVDRGRYAGGSEVPWFNRCDAN